MWTSTLYRFPALLAWTRSLVSLSFFGRRPCDVVRSLSGVPLISIVYRCEVGSWLPPIPRPFPPRTIAINTPPLPLSNHGTWRWWRSWRTDGSWANEHSRALNRMGVFNWPPGNEPYFTLSTTKTKHLVGTSNCPSLHRGMSNDLASTTSTFTGHQACGGPQGLPRRSIANSWV